MSISSLPEMYTETASASFGTIFILVGKAINAEIFFINIHNYKVLNSFFIRMFDIIRHIFLMERYLQSVLYLKTSVVQESMVLLAGLAPSPLSRFI